MSRTWSVHSSSCASFNTGHIDLHRQDWLDYVLGLSDNELPQTFSTSYGDDEQTVPLDYATSVCNMYAQLGTRGSSVLFSSGDFGVGGGDCLTNDGTDKVQFQPIFPASCKSHSILSQSSVRMPSIRQLLLHCYTVQSLTHLRIRHSPGPYVTAVGATTGYPSEYAANFSGGGFSNYFSQPSYQSDAVSTFLSGLGDDFQGLYK